MQVVKQFEDIKPGMILEYFDGRRFIVLLDRFSEYGFSVLPVPFQQISSSYLPREAVESNPGLWNIVK